MAIYDAGKILDKVLHKRGWWGNSNCAMGVYTGNCDTLGLNPHEWDSPTQDNQSLRDAARAENIIIRNRRRLIERLRPSTVQISMLWNRIEANTIPPLPAPLPNPIVKGAYNWRRTDDMMNWLTDIDVAVWIMFSYPPRQWTALRDRSPLELAHYYRTCLTANRDDHVSGAMGAFRDILTEAMKVMAASHPRPNGGSGVGKRRWTRSVCTGATSSFRRRPTAILP